MEKLTGFYMKKLVSIGGNLFLLIEGEEVVYH